MFPPSQNASFNLETLSGVAGSVSIACWIVVFSPQILQNFRRGSAKGLSLAFLAVWLLGDLFNIIGAVLQGVLPTMIVLAAYYTVADIILLFQCLYYRRYDGSRSRRYRCHHQGSPQSPRDQVSHPSPVTALLDPPKGSGDESGEDDRDGDGEVSEALSSPWKAALFNTVAIISVCLVGALGWQLSPPGGDNGSDKTDFSPLGQLFGYLCAVLYLASRVPQILLNYRRHSCEGVSVLFFLYAGIGNATYALSIVANNTAQDYWKHIAVNASWLLGSLGTLALDAVILAQFIAYQDVADSDVHGSDGGDIE